MNCRQLLLILFLFSSSPVVPQQSALSRAVNFITSYIADENFNCRLKSQSHIALVDSIYLAALKYNKNNISETLLALTFATVPYKKVPVTIPLIKTTIYYPLTSADDSLFRKKNNNLPSKLYFDTPANDYGDRDKIAHFFGNAFIGYHSTFLDISNILGLFVEVFEESFKVQSSVDERDLQTNFYGRAFGKTLKENEFVLPSQSLILYPLFYSFYHL